MLTSNLLMIFLNYLTHTTLCLFSYHNLLCAYLSPLEVPGTKTHPLIISGMNECIILPCLKLKNYLSLVTGYLLSPTCKDWSCLQRFPFLSRFRFWLEGFGMLEENQAALSSIFPEIGQISLGIPSPGELHGRQEARKPVCWCGGAGGMEV